VINAPAWRGLKRIERPFSDLLTTPTPTMPITKYSSPETSASPRTEGEVKKKTQKRSCVACKSIASCQDLTLAIPTLHFHEHD
jgi:hypothetical protein